MRFYEWDNDAFGSYNVLASLTSREGMLLSKKYGDKVLDAEEFHGRCYYFVDTVNMVFTPVRVISYIFGGMYNAYSPIGGKLSRVNLKDYKFKELMKMEEERRKRNAVRKE